MHVKRTRVQIHLTAVYPKVLSRFEHYPYNRVRSASKSLSSTLPSLSSCRYSGFMPLPNNHSVTWLTKNFRNR